MPHIFSVVFSAACLINLFIGIYVFYINPKCKTNRLFFIVSVSLAFWAFGFSNAVSAKDLATVLFWRRFSALGFGAFYAVLLHFFIVFSGHKRLIKKWWINALLYLPTVVTYLGFTYFPEINPGQYNMVLTSLGWINIAVNNAWDYFFIVYYIFYCAAVIYLTWQWGRTSCNRRQKKQASYILFSFLLMLLAGSLTDILGNMIFSVSIPQLAPLLMVFPNLVIFYSIKKVGLLNPKHVDEDKFLMTDQIRQKIVNYIANGFLAGGLLNFISQYLLTDNASLLSVLLFSGGLIFIGFIFQAIQRIIKQKDIKDIMNAVVFLFIVPIITLRFINNAGATVWAFAFVLLVIIIVFENKIIHIALMTSILLTQLVVWILKPEVTMTINGAHYIARFGFFIISFWLVLFIKRIYSDKLGENAAQINYQKMITEISTDFISVDERNLDSKSYNILQKLGTFTMANGAYIYVLDNDIENLTCTHRWSLNEEMTVRIIPEKINVSNFPLITQYLKNDNIIALPDVSESIPEIGNELSRLINSQEKSLIVIPLIMNSEFFGFLGFDAERKTKKMPETQLDFLRILTNIYVDAIKKVNYEKEIHFMAFYDALTKLPNRTLFKDRVAQSISLNERTNKVLAVVFLDLDGFKSINDASGHDAGDGLLVEVAMDLSKSIRKSDAICRFGGDEFLILLNNMEAIDNITPIVKKLLSSFDKPFMVDGQEFFVTVSAGVAVYPYDGEDAETLIKNADVAMYKAKERGKNQYLFCTADMKNDVLMKIKLKNSLYRALERDEFILHYQPLVCTVSKKIIGAEALIRWNHPELGMIAPSLFIPLTEQTGLIGSIGEWVLRTACKQCKAWQLAGLPPMRIAVNVSIIQFRNPMLVSMVARILAETQLEPQYLELEITEGVAVNESTYILGVLNDLKKLGVSLAIDDFGTEYSSLSRLTSMPMDRIKMDMQFVRGICKSEKDNAIATGIIRLAHSLGLKVVAEGVETESQLNFLGHNNCDEIQGFYFYKPVKSEDLERILRDDV